MDALETKYTRIEYERRFLVLPGATWKSRIEPYSKTYEDKYLADTRLRLRILTDADTGRRVIKLNKKFESDSAYFRNVGRILLSPGEYELINRIKGDRLKKTRHYHHYHRRVFSIDVSEGELEGLILCEIEAESLEELISVEPPPYAKFEVTEDPFFTGGNLCRTSRSELQQKLTL